ncbi:MAG TPA: hypothetical protein VFA46_02900 [Actinomycetes bacterium]|jgi:hypothetical protein|nr:hypothetical protein [Actinomycetes bacterium]
MAPPRSYRRSARPVYPGVLPFLVGGLLGMLAYRMGYRLPWHAAIYAKVLLEAGVVWLVWKAWKAFRAAMRNQLRLFNAQSLLAYAVALQAFILLLRA